MTYTWPAARQAIASALRAEASLAGWEVYAEIPEQLAGGRSIAIGPQSPYRTFETLSTGATHLTIHALVPRASAPAMDQLEAALDGILAVLLELPEVGIGDTVQPGLVDDLGGASYLVLSIDATYE